MLDLDILTEVCVTVFNIGCIILIIPVENANIHLQTKHKAGVFVLAHH